MGAQTDACGEIFSLFDKIPVLLSQVTSFLSCQENFMQKKIDQTIDCDQLGIIQTDTERQRGIVTSQSQGEEVKCEGTIGQH